MNKPEGYPPISVIMCTLNEEESITRILPKIPSWVDEIIIVDGHSIDNTIEIAKKIIPRIKVFSQPGTGKGDALRCGITHAKGEIIVTMDADDATDPDEITKFINALMNGYDYAKGTRLLKGKTFNKPWYRITGNWIITITFDVLFLRLYTDICSGYNAFWKNKLQTVKLFSSDGFENEPLINARIAKSTINVIEVGHVDRGRSKGEVKELSWRQGMKAIKSIIRERFRDPT